MEQISRWQEKRCLQNAARRVRWNGGMERPQEAVGPVAEIERGVRMRRRKSPQQFARVDAHAGKIGSNAVGCIQCDSQSAIRYSFSLRCKVVRPIPSSLAAFGRLPLVYSSARRIASFSVCIRLIGTGEGRAG